jgi:hypothetical protein
MTTLQHMLPYLSHIHPDRATSGFVKPADYISHTWQITTGSLLYFL